MAITTDENDIKERLSMAYITTVAARAGCQIAHWQLDKQSVDGTIRPVSGSRAAIDVQVKATSQDVVDGLEVFFDLPVKNYNDLRSTTETNPHYLVIVHFPGQINDWLNLTADQLIVNGCAYWASLHGAPSVQSGKTRRVRFPRIQRFTPEILVNMIDAAPARIAAQGS